MLFEDFYQRKKIRKYVFLTAVITLSLTRTIANFIYLIKAITTKAGIFLKNQRYVKFSLEQENQARGYKSFFVLNSTEHEIVPS